MISKTQYTFSSKSTCEFIFDSDDKLAFLKDLPISSFDRIFFIFDENVDRVWGAIIREQFQSYQKPTFSFSAPAEENSKSIHFYPKVIQFLEANQCGRFDIIIAIGGGIIIDLASFVSSTYMRGVPLGIVATTLIGQTDASTAGKTCLNSERSKNLLGTFYFPNFVYANIALLKTNSTRYARQGYSEVFKYGLLGSKQLLSLLDSYANANNDYILMDIVRTTVATRIKIRETDPLASNLGHTFGHAIERLSDYAVLHGDAISAGTVIALHFAASRGLIAQNIVDDILKSMMHLNLNVFMDNSFSAKEIVSKMMLDKKSSSTKLNLVLIRGIEHPYSDGKSPFYSVSPDEVEAFLDSFLSAYPYKTDNLANFLQNDKLEYK